MRCSICTISHLSCHQDRQLTRKKFLSKTNSQLKSVVGARCMIWAKILHTCYQWPSPDVTKSLKNITCLTMKYYLSPPANHTNKANNLFLEANPIDKTFLKNMCGHPPIFFSCTAIHQFSVNRQIPYISWKNIYMTASEPYNCNS